MSPRADIAPAEWRLGSAGIAMIAVSYGLTRYGYGLFEPEIRADFQLSVGASGVVASGAYIGYLVALSLVAVLADRTGPRPLVAAAGVSAGSGMAVAVLAQQPWQLLAGLIVAGASSGFAWAPFSDAVDQLIARPRRHVVLAAIPSGTAFGIVIAGVLVLAGLGASWRAVWIIFCAGAVIATAHNIHVLRRTGPARRPKAPGRRPTFSSFVRPGARGLFSTALSYGVVGSVYWTFSVAAIAQANTTSSVMTSAFWTLIGIAGIAAIGSGRAFGEFGLPRSHAALMAGLAFAAALIALAPHWWPVVVLSAAVYGAVFMATSGLLAVWSYRLFPEQPSVGFSATVFFLGLGAILGPAGFGAIAEHWGLRSALLLAAAIPIATLPFRPQRTPHRDPPMTARDRG